MSITYADLIASARPFFLSRGGDEFANNDRMMFFANCSLQDVYNIDAATFTYVQETLTGVQNGTDTTTNVFTTQHNIVKVQQCAGSGPGIGDNYPMSPTLFIMDGTPSEFKFETGTNKIITPSQITEITVVYTKGYKWASYATDLNEPIPVPDRYVPAILKFIYDWASPVNLMAGESTQVDFFSHAMTRLNMLSNNDSLTDAYRLNSAI